MGLFIVTVLGFVSIMGITGYAILHFFSQSMNSHDAEVVDPKPTVRY
ncbi:hypothetical protein C7437_10740 [Psychrobacillus insolitus]|uniref:Uncharacterized protein n=1 Tax=Psychrobacillus insolitus TaxID=1461 RepID=A0A2W7MCD9_9BACI|nr:hypothetical protein [Psychrobacillus insolitus]PZX03087.1 hypothetical protein C7437_10740 [Psychrobacillus insolitus]